MQKIFIPFLLALTFLVACSSEPSEQQTQLADTTAETKSTIPDSMKNWDRKMEVPTKRDTPEEVVQIIFEAARANKPEMLDGLCPPSKTNDKNTDCICAQYGLYTPHACDEEVSWNDYVQEYQGGGIVTAAFIEGNTAEVDFIYNDDEIINQTMHLVKEDTLWYLHHFEKKE